MRTFYLSFLILIYSCTNTNYSDVPHEVQLSFNTNSKDFEFIRNFFVHNEFDIRELDYEDGKWKTRKKEYRIFLQENGFVETKDIDSLLSKLTRLNIVEAGGDINYTELHFNHGITECYIMRYEVKTSNSNRKIDSVYYHTEKDDFWYIQLSEHWFAKRVSCF